MYSISLGLKDWQNIIRWHGSFSNEKEISLSDRETQIKIEAIMINIKESVRQENDPWKDRFDL